MNEAYQAFAEMTIRGLEPNNITYNSIISAFCRAGNMAEALKLQQNMRQSGLVPDVYTSNNRWFVQTRKLENGGQPFIGHVQ